MMKLLRIEYLYIYLSFSLLLIPAWFIYESKIDNSYQKKVSDERFILASDELYENMWVDSVINKMTLDEKIGQLFMVDVYPLKGKTDKNRITELIKKYKIGGLIFFKSGPVLQAKLTNYYQYISQTPLMIAGDYEWGLSMRMDSTVNYPRQMTLGAVTDNNLIYEFGSELADQFNMLRININFAPVVDVNNNQMNPVINTRSFGDDRDNVSNKGISYMLGMQDKKVLAVAKHFPGHGDTDTDSHQDLPVINHDRKRLDSIEIYPFKKLINKGVGGVMIAHLNIPALDNRKNVPSSLSKPIVTDILKKELNFRGLIFTDALGMQGVAKFSKPGETEVKAIIAGVDVLLMPEDVPIAFAEIKKALELKKISEKDINERCKKILKVKKWFGLNNYKPIDTQNLYNNLNSKKAVNLNKKIIEASVSVVKNNNNFIPLETDDSVKTASVNIAETDFDDFNNTLALYRKIDFFFIDKNSDKAFFDKKITELVKYNTVIVNIFGTTTKFPNGISDNTLNLVNKISAETNVIINIFGSPYSISRFSDTKNIKAIVHASADSYTYRNTTAQGIFGGMPLIGKLPVKLKNIDNKAYFQSSKTRLKYSDPSEFDIDTTKLAKIDSIINDAVTNRATPGATILAIKNGVVFYYKSFGYHTYEKKIRTQNSDVYDLASLTKILASTLSVMKLYDLGRINIESPVSKYIPELDTTNKRNITIKQTLAHQSGLTAWLPFYVKTYSDIEQRILDTAIYAENPIKNKNLQVAENLFILNSYPDTIYNRIYKSEIDIDPKYKYSDIGFMLIYKAVNNILDNNFEQFLYRNFYGPLGAYTTGYNPISKIPANKILPTEDDIIFRKQTILGYVHDYGAALTGGVNGHAGLFANANDIAKIMQMLIQKGKYGSKQFISEKTVELFTKCAFCENKNRRALGFDRIITEGGGIPSFHASENSYGHSGFTGTFVWNDPDKQLTFIFLSNRTYPSSENTKLLDLNVRTKIHDILYEVFEPEFYTSYNF